MGLFVLIVAFSYSIFFIVQRGFGLPTNGPMFQIYSAILAILSVLIYAFSFKKIPLRTNIATFLICSFVAVLYFATRVFYGYTNPRYQTYFLSMGVHFIPAILVAVAVVSDRDIWKKVEMAMPTFILLYTLILANVVFTAKQGLNVSQTFNQGGLTYQSISYYSIFAFGLTMYLIANKNYSGWMRMVLIGLAVLQFAMSIMAGGRGAFVLGIVFLFYFGMKRLSFWKLLQYSIILLVAGYAIQMAFANDGIFNQGFDRIFNFFSDSNAIDTDQRWVRWHLAYEAFLRSPIIGHGLGSVFYEVGFYSHNIFTDLLCEGGILLGGIFVYCLVLFLKKSRQLIRADYRYEIIIIIFLCSFIMCCFSGYYLDGSGMWLALACVLCQGKEVYTLQK